MGSFGISEGNITGRKKKERKKERNPTDCVPNNNFQRELVQTLTIATSKWGLDREAWTALLRVRTRPECPEGNLRELTWASKPDCGRATTRKALT